MKNFANFLFIGLLAIAMSCSKQTQPVSRTDNPADPVQDDVCKNVPKLTAQKFKNEFTQDRVFEFAADAAIAAKETASKSVDIGGEASIKPEFANTVTRYFNIESETSQEFWEQDLFFRQTICFLQDYQNREDLAQSQKDRIFDRVMEIVEARNTYMFQVKKKTGSDQQ